MIVLLLLLMATLSLKLSESLYLRDPQSSELGNKIVQHGIELIDRLGFELFTFKKLADEIGSTEASVYRYFENKHRLLLYLIDWYWTWLEYRIDYSIHGIDDPERQLEISMDVLAEEKVKDPSFDFVDEAALARIVVAEFEKTYLTRHVDTDNQEGVFSPFKALCKKMATLITRINPAFPYPQSLISTALMASNQQVFFSQHLPSLSNIREGKATSHNKLASFLKLFVFNTIRHHGN